MKEKEMEKALNSDLEQIAEVIEKPAEPQSQEETSEKKKKAKLGPKKFFHQFKKLSLPLKVAITLPFVLIVVGFITTGLVLTFKLDSYVFKTTLTGTVRQFDGSSVSDVKVCIKEKCTFTNEVGQFKLENLKYGNNTVTAEKDSFQKFNKEVELKRGENNIYDYGFFTLKYSNTGTVRGQLKVLSGDIKFEEMYVRIAETNNPLKEDGSFTIENVPVGKYTIQIISPNYVDLEEEVEVVEGDATVEFSELEPAGDVLVNPVDWLTRELVKDLVIAQNNNLETEYGPLYLLIKDVPVGTKLQLTFSKKGYNTKDLGEVEIVQGVTEKGDVEMVRSGKVVYVSDRTGNDNIYIANLDGSGEKRLTDNKGDSNDPYLTPDGKYVRFVSTRDGLKNEYGYPLSLAYSVDVNSGRITKLSKTNYSESGKNIENYDLASLKRSFRKDEKLYVGNLDGTGIKIMDHGENYLETIFSNNGKFLIYNSYVYDMSKEQYVYGAYYADFATAHVQKMFEMKGNNTGLDLYDISDDRKYALFQTSSDGKFNVVVRDLTKKQNTTIASSSESKSQLQFSPDSKSVSFIAQRDGMRNLYLLNIETKEEVQLSRGEDLSGYTWMSNLVYFSAKNKLFIADSKSPENTKLITDKIAYDAGYYH